MAHRLHPAPGVMLRALLIRSGQPPISVDPGEWAALRDETADLLWVDAEAPSPEEVDLLAHRLRIGAALGELMRQDEPRSAVSVDGDRYGLTVHAVVLEMDEPPFHERLLRIDLVVDGHALLSVHDRPLPFAPALEQRLSRGTRLQPCDASSLLHVLLDSLLDHYAQLADRLERRLEALEDRLLREPDRRALGDTLRVKRRVQGLRRLVAAFDEPLTTLLAPDSPLSGRDDGGLAPFRTLN